MPSISGIFGSDSAPAAETRRSAVTVAAEVVTRQCPAASSQVASSTVVPNRNRSITSDSAATRFRYAWISGWGENEGDHSGFGAKEKEYSCEGTSQAAPG